MKDEKRNYHIEHLNQNVHASILIIFREELMHLPIDFIFERVIAFT